MTGRVTHGENDFCKMSWNCDARRIAYHFICDLPSPWIRWIRLRQVERYRKHVDIRKALREAPNKVFLLSRTRDGFSNTRCGDISRIETHGVCPVIPIEALADLRSDVSEVEGPVR